MNKDTAQYDYFNTVIIKSWTWGKLTQEEQDRFINGYSFDKIKGTARQRIEWLNSMYHMFLLGLGYTPIGWRE